MEWKWRIGNGELLIPTLSPEAENSVLGAQSATPLGGFSAQVGTGF